MKDETKKRLQDYVNSTDEDVDDIQLDFDEANEVLELDEKYQKLKEAFEELLEKHLPKKDYSENIINKWRVKAGIK